MLPILPRESKTHEYARENLREGHNGPQSSNYKDMRNVQSEGARYCQQELPPRRIKPKRWKRNENQYVEEGKPSVERGKEDLGGLRGRLYRTSRKQRILLSS